MMKNLNTDPVAFPGQNSSVVSSEVAVGGGMTAVSGCVACWRRGASSWGRVAYWGCVVGSRGRVACWGRVARTRGRVGCCGSVAGSRGWVACLGRVARRGRVANYRRRVVCLIVVPGVSYTFRQCLWTEEGRQRSANANYVWILPIFSFLEYHTFLRVSL